MPSSSSSNEERCFSDVLRVPSHLSDIDEKLVWACEARKADLARYSMPTHCSAVSILNISARMSLMFAPICAEYESQVSSL